MKFFPVLELIVYAYINIPKPDLGSYLKLDTINSYISDIVNDTQSVATNSTYGKLNYLEFSNSDDSNSPLVLFIASLHGGFPMNTYTAVQLVDQILYSQDISDKLYDLSNRISLGFVLVANPDAYIAAQNAFNKTGNFKPIWTDLQGSSWNCTNNSLAGYDPDRCFPVNYVPSTNKCAETGYSGTKPLQSSISSSLVALLKDADPDIVFILDNAGGQILYPYSGSTGNLTKKDAAFYNEICDNFDSCEAHNSLESKNGTLLDFIYTNYSLVFEIRGNNDLDYYEKLVTKVIDSYLINVDVGDLQVNTRNCENNCNNFSYTKTFTFAISSESYSDYNFDLVINPGNSNFGKLVDQNLTITQVVEQDDKEIVMTSNISCQRSIGANLRVCTDQVLPGYATLKFELVYLALDEKALNTNFSAVFTSSQNSFYYDDIWITEEDSTSGDEDKDDTRKGVFTGGILLLVLVLLMIVSAGLIYCCDKR